MKKKETLRRDETLFLRQLDIFNPLTHGDVTVNIIGAGGIGSFTTLALGKLGIAKLKIWDGDKVEEHNLPSQLHSPEHLGENKAVALARTVHQMTGADTEGIPDFWNPDYYGDSALSDIVISAVDHMEKTKSTKTAGRRELWAAVKDSPSTRLFVDGRLGGQVIRVLAIRPLADTFKYEWFERRMFKQSQVKELPCTARNVIDVGFFIAALITRVVRQHLVSNDVSEYDLTLDVNTFTTMSLHPDD